MKNKNHKSIPNNLRKYRKTKGLRQKDVARVLGLKSASIISRWENGICLPRPVNMFKLAVLYRTMADALFVDLRRLLKKDILKVEQEVLQNKSQKQK